MNWKRTARWSWLILPFLLLAVWPSAAAAWSKPKAPCEKLGAGEACLYEVTEEAVFLDSGGTPVDPTATPPAFRSATAAIMGTTGALSSVCPMPVPCSIAGVGSSFISLSGTPFTNPNFGKGTFRGDFAVVVNEPGTVDAAEVVIAVGSFAGQIDLFPAVLFELGLGGAPVGSLNGMYCVGSGCTPDRTLTGTFRIPFTSAGVQKKLKKHMFLLPDRGVRPAFYQLDNGKRDPVEPNERSLGAPTVRLEATFE